MRDLLLTAIIGASLPAAFLRPWIGVLVWVWIGTMSPHQLTWQLRDAPVALIVAAVTVAGLLFSLRDLRRPPFRLPVLLILGLWGWTLVTTWAAALPTTAWETFIHNSKKFVFIILSLALFQDLKRLRWLIVVVAGSVGFFGVKGAVFSLLTAGQYRVYGPPQSVIADNNDLALALNMVIPILIFLAFNEGRRWQRLAWGATAVCSILTVMFTYSRGGFLGLAAILSVMALKSKYRSAALTLGVVLLVAAIAFAPPAWVDRIESIGSYEQDASAQGRFDAWRFAWSVALAHPLVGGGFGAFHEDLYAVHAPEAPKALGAHSIYFDVLGTQGFVGLALFLGLLGAAIWRSEVLHRRLRRRGATWFGGCAEAIQYAIVAYAVSGAFLGRAWFDLFYQLLAVLVLLEALAEPVLEMRTVPAVDEERRELAPCAA